MTLRSQAIVIRDETEEGANTHLRVGNLLVEMADAIAATSQSDPPYIGAIIFPDEPTVIGVSGTYVPVNVGSASGNVSANKFTDNGDGTFTCNATDPDGYYGLYKVQITMSAHTSAGSHVIGACIGLDSVAGETTAVSQTLTSGANKENQICLNVIIGLQNGDTFGIWMTDKTGTSSVYVTNIQMTLGFVALLPL